MNRNDITRVLDEHRIRQILRPMCVVCECGLEFDDEDWHRRHVANRLWTALNEQSGIEYLRNLIARMLVLHPWAWDDVTTKDGKVCCPCGHASDTPLEHHRHVCEELADAIIDTEKEWNLK